MLHATTLSLSSQGLPLPHVFYRQDAEAETLGMLLPGLNYSSALPLLYYPRSLLLQEMGADVMQVDYAYHQIPGFLDLPEPERYARLKDDAAAALEGALAQRSYRRLVLVGKSLGTAAMATLLPRAAGLPGLDSRWIWLTPLLSDPTLRKAIQAYRPASLFVVGAADHFYQPEPLEALRAATGGEALVIPGAGHRLEIDGALEPTLDALVQTMTAVKKFLRGPSPAQS